ncbi:MAG TPA: P-loop NTPase [Candidatus Acidoferrales bacterium]|nr:P-loop NTPase [Candidatus Acidoferrales bacterium]
MLDQAVKLREVVSAQTKVLPIGKLPYKVAVVSGKGGVGKSNIVLNLGMALARGGARVLLVDGNVNLSNLDILCAASPKYRLLDVVDGTAQLKDAVAEISPNVFLLAGSSDGRLKKLSSGDAAVLFREVGLMEPVFQYALIDTAGGIVQESISLALLSDEVFVVATPEPTAVMDAYVLVKVLKRINSNADLKLLINMAKSAEEAEEVKAKFDLVSEHFLNLKVDYAGFIPSDQAIEQAVSVQSPLLQEFPDSLSSSAIKLIADGILARRESESSGRKE